MKVKVIYQKFGVMPNLAEHMLRVTSVAMFIRDHWAGPNLDWELIKKTTLLHDLGNVVKFDLDAHPEFLGSEVKNLEHWKQVQRETISKYGSDDHEATSAMLGELGVSDQINEIILGKSFGNTIAMVKSADWYPKILGYSDLRVMPQGVVTLEKRLRDVRDRMPKYSSRPDFEDILNACRELEKQIQKNLDVPVSELTDNIIVDNEEGFLDSEI